MADTTVLPKGSPEFIAQVLANRVNIAKANSKKAEQFVPEENAEIVSKASEIEKGTDSASKENSDKFMPEDKGNMKAFPDGSKLEWDWAREGVQIHEHPLFFVGADAMGIDRSTAHTQFDVVGDIVKMALDILQDDNPAELFNFLSYHMRHAPAGSNKLFGFHRYMQILQRGGETDL